MFTHESGDWTGKCGDCGSWRKAGCVQNVLACPPVYGSRGIGVNLDQCDTFATTYWRMPLKLVDVSDISVFHIASLND